jgi:hypothetical protein
MIMTNHKFVNFVMKAAEILRLEASHTCACTAGSSLPYYVLEDKMGVFCTGCTVCY